MDRTALARTEAWLQTLPEDLQGTARVDQGEPADVIAAAGAGGTATALAAPPEQSSGSFAQAPAVNEHKDLGRNDPCWCGSGKKFKKCHGA